MGYINKSKNIYFVSVRLKDWLHILGLPTLGSVYYSKFDLYTFNFLLGLIISSLYLAHGFSLNTYFDAHIEPYWNRALSSIEQKPFKKVLIFSYLIFLINCSVSLLHSVLIFYLVIIGSITGLIYSAPPLRLKRIIPLNFILNSFGFSILFIIGFASVGKTVTLPSIALAVFFGLIFIPLQIIHQISHSGNDREANISTIFSTLGPKATVRLFNLSLLIIISWALVISLFLNREHIYFFCATCLFMLSLFYIMRRLKMEEGIDNLNATKARLIFRKICIIYGIVIFLIFAFVI